MARCPTALLGDVVPVLTVLRTWSGVIEKKPGVFYAYRQPFLHFHLGADGRRRADIRSPAGWTSMDLPRPLSHRRGQSLLRELRRRYAERGGSARRRGGGSTAGGPARKPMTARFRP
jgi:hypothetical protein